MANELPEVVPDVESMPTTGWFCQTGGSARRRVTKNSSFLKSGLTDLEGIYDVAGVPGHTHNASAVVSVDANYSAYRQRALEIPAGVWGYAALALPVGQLTDSVEPDNAEERYDRAIERCVGYVSLFPENCTGYIREPTRSIGEIRTLVAPKARLDTLTYSEERAGWRVPKDADDQKELAPRDELVSVFPDVHIDVRPLTAIRAATLNLGVSPGSLYMQTPTFRYRIVSDEDGLGNIGTHADGTDWDGTLRFVWDDDSRRYKTLSEVSVTLYDVREVSLAAGVEQVPIYDTALDQNPGGGHAHQLTVTFPILQTTKAFDGFCWLGNLQNEEAINYATRVSGLALAPRIPVEVIGVQAHIGPFQWIGMPAYRVPVGGTYAHPTSDILQEQMGDGTATDLQFNHWDKFDAFARRGTPPTFDGFLRYQWRQQEAERLYTANANAGTTSRRAEEAFNMDAREEDNNSGIFAKRNSGILVQLTGHHYRNYPNFARVAVTSYETALGGANLAQAHVTSRGFRQSRRSKHAVNAAATAALPAAPIIFAADGTIAAASTFQATAQGIPDTFTLDSETGFTFAAAQFAAGVPAALEPFVNDNFCVLPMTPLFYQLDAGGLVGDFSGDDELFIGKTVGGVRLYVPKVICNCTTLVNTELQLRYDLSDVWETLVGRRVQNTLENQGNLVADARFFVRSWSLWLHPQDGVTSNFEAAAGNLPNNAQVMRNLFRDEFATGNKILVPAASWGSADDAGSVVFLYDFVFALSDTDFSGVYFETVNATAVNGQERKLCFLAPARPRSAILYEAAGGAGTAYVNGRVLTDVGAVYVWDQALGAAGGSVRRATHAEVHAQNAQNLNMYLLGPDWFRTHVGNDPYATIRADSERLGAVFQSIKRISQHICAPVVNPNLRIGAGAPLNHDTRHLPPELRDFRLQLSDIDWGRLQTDRVSLNELTMYEFKGGTQKVGAEQNILYLPQFREFQMVIAGNEFEFACFSELGSPSYFCFFARSATTDILQQPLIKTLSIFNKTTQKKSNSIYDLSIGQMYHLTQRNVHAGAEYDRVAFNRRQTVLLSAEDVGLLGLSSSQYQAAKRVEYVFSGTTDRPGQLYVVLVYNNRGLHIDGRRLQVVTLHE